MDLGVAVQLLEQDPRAEAWRRACADVAATLVGATHLPMGLLVLTAPQGPVWDLVDHLHDLADEAGRSALRPLAVHDHGIPAEHLRRADREHYPSPRDVAASDEIAGVGLGRVAAAGPGESVLVVTDRPLPETHLAALTLARGRHACVVGVLVRGLAAEAALCEDRVLVEDAAALPLAVHGVLAALRDEANGLGARPEPALGLLDA